MGLADRAAFNAFLEPLRKSEWVVYAKEPFAGPKPVLAYLARYTHRVAIANSRLIRAGADGVTFRVKDYRVDGPGRYTTMTLAAHEFSGADQGDSRDSARRAGKASPLTSMMMVRSARLRANIR